MTHVRPRMPAWPWRRAAALVWVAPVSVVGAALALVALAAGASAQRVDGVLEVSGGKLGRAAERHTRFDAITLGHVVLGVQAGALDRWRRHEHAHVRQYERWGVLMPVLYAASSLRAWRHGRCAYAQNAFEREARIVARRGAGLLRTSPLAAYTATHDRPRSGALGRA